jgi:hypothetical protein
MRRLIILTILTICLGCSGVRVMPGNTLGDATYTMMEYRAGSPLGANVVVVDVYETKGGQTKLLHSNASSTGGLLDALIGSGKLLEPSSGAAEKGTAATGAAK